MSLEIGDAIKIWNSEAAEFNTTPSYYFRFKRPPNTNIIDHSPLTLVEGNNILKDIKCKFGINYDSQYCGLNYFYLCLYILNPKTYNWELKERSPILYNTDDVFEFIGLTDKQKYKICGVCIDCDGDEWFTEEVEFSTANTIISTYNTLTNFNKKTITIDIVLTDILNQYRSASLEFYKLLKSDMDEIPYLIYAGGGLAKSDNIVFFNKWSDYNIKNDFYYDYFVRVNYTGKESEIDEGVDLFLVGQDVLTEFTGTSILGLEKVSDKKLSITNNFNLFYSFQNNEMSELTNEVSREYIDSFGKYPRELKGHQSYMSGSCTGLLGRENDGLYEEPRAIRSAWNNFVNDDTVKLYRGCDGETMVISIESNKIKPYYFSSVGLVNEVSISFKEIASTSSYTIFTTEKTGD